jgi:uncharacterized protein YjbI with pentapeptide repeats
MPEQPLPPQTGDDPAAWRAFWEKLGMSWRTAPEIGAERQAELAEFRAHPVDSPFEHVALSRADVEWLLATHESNGTTGPVLHGSLFRSRPGPNLSGARLPQTDLSGLPLSETDFRRAEFDKVDLREARLYRANLQGAVLVFANLEGAFLSSANLRSAALVLANLERANLTSADLHGAILNLANLQGADLTGANLQNASLGDANLQGAALHDANLSGADLRRAMLNHVTGIERATVGKGPEDSIRVADILWGGANLSVVNNQDGVPWSGVEFLKDELVDEQDDGFTAERANQQLTTAVRAYRQLATALRAQGLADEADRFAYRAQELRLRRAWREVKAGHWKDRLRQIGPAMGLGALWGLAGFGYRPARPLRWWVAGVVAGTLAFYAVDHPMCACWPLGVPNGEGVWAAFIASINALHGRGVFFTDTGAPTLAQGGVASVLAVFGLVIEATLIATFTQRFFGR